MLQREGTGVNETKNPLKKTMTTAVEMTRVARVHLGSRLSTRERTDSRLAIHLRHVKVSVEAKKREGTALSRRAARMRAAIMTSEPTTATTVNVDDPARGHR